MTTCSLLRSLKVRDIVAKTKVNKKLQRDWIHALESGAYKQGTSSIRNAKDEFCCFGVLCDVKNSKLWDQDEPNCNFRYSEEGNALMAPVKLQEEVGLSDAIYHQKTSWDFAYANDGSLPELEQQFSFEEIASILRMEFNIWD